MKSARAFLMVFAPLSLVQAGFQLTCATNSQERLDPLISPGNVSGHTHEFAGSPGGIAYKSPTTQDLQSAPCTSCTVKEDKSTYWHPALYYQYKNGSFISVPTDDLLVQYYQNGPEKIQAYPPGFRMLAGSMILRSYQNTSAQQFGAIKFQCLGQSGQITTSLPTGYCQSGVKASIEFPSCWNGDLDSPNHASHVAYAGTNSSFLNGGNAEHPYAQPGNARCPSSHPIRLPSLVLTRTFFTGNFENSKAKNPNQPFVFAMGDPTGFGWHADFIGGWITKVLQNAIDTCTSTGYFFNTQCNGFTLQSIRQTSAPGAPLCRKTSIVNEAVTDTILPSLPGCNPVQTGPADASIIPCSLQPAIFNKPQIFSGPVPPVGVSEAPNVAVVLPSTKQYKFASCYANPNKSPIISTKVAISGSMTAQKCLKACAAKKLKYCALGPKACYGAKALAKSSKKVALSQCWSTCSADSLHYCGGPQSLSVYALS